MPAPNILREFLLAIGFKVDDEQFRKIQNVVNKTTEVIENLGEATAAVAVLIDKNVLQIAESFDKLYYSAQRIGTSVRALQSFQFAAQMIGVSADAATSSLEGMARAIRLNPGLVGYLNNLGVKTQGRDTTQVTIDLLDKLKGMQPYIAAQIGLMFGINPDDLNMMLKNLDKMKEAEQERREMFANAGLDPDKLAGDSAAFERDMLRMHTQIEILRSLIAERFMPAIDVLVDGISKVVGFVSRMDKATGGASTYAGAAGVLGGTAATAYFGKKWLAKALPNAMRKLFGLPALAEGAEVAAGAGAAEGAAGVAGGAAAGISIAPVIVVVSAVLAGLGLGWLLNKTGALDLGGEGSIWNAHSGVNSIYEFFGKAKDKVSKVIGDMHNPGNLRSWGNSPIVNGFAQFTNDRDGLSAMAGQLLRYQSRGNDTISGIISKWAPPSDHNNTPGYIDSVRRALGLSDHAHLNLNDPALLSRLMAAMIHVEKGRDPYSLQTIQSAANYRLGQDAARGGASSIIQHTTIEVHGGNDPSATARHVLRGQKDVNASLVRNAVGVPQ